MNQTSTASEAAVRVAERGDSTGIRDRTDPRQVLADRVEQLYGQMWLGILATFAIGAIATFEFWSERLKELPPAPTGDLPARCFSRRIPTSSRCSSLSCWPA